LERYFLAPPGRRWFFETENDSACLAAEGVDGTEHLEADKGRIDVDLDMWGNPEHCVLLIYSKWGGGLKQTYSSKGDFARLRERVRSMHDTVLPVPGSDTQKSEASLSDNLSSENLAQSPAGREPGDGS
jgi:hypothetical protein